MEIRAQPGSPRSAPDRTTVPSAAKAGEIMPKSSFVVTKLAWLGKYSAPSRPSACSRRASLVPHPVHGHGSPWLASYRRLDGRQAPGH